MIKTMTGYVATLGILFAASAAAQDAGAQAKPKPEAAKKSAGTARIALSSTLWDFGEKWYGEPCLTEITLRNEGDAPLKIAQMRSSCGCTVARPTRAKTWDGMTLQPGEEEIIKLTYNTKKVKPKVSQTVTITSNDPENPTVQIQVKGAIRQLFQTAPSQRITFTGLEQNSNKTKEMVLTSNIEEPVKLTLKPLSETVPFEAKLETMEDGKRFKLLVTTKPPLKLGSNATSISLETDHARFKSMTIPVSAYVAPRVQISPKTLYVPRKGSTSIQRYVRVRYQRKSPIKVTDIKSSHETITAELMPPRETAGASTTISMHEIRVTLPPASKFPAEGATLTITTDDKDPAYQSFEVKVLLQPEPRRTAAGRNRGATPSKKPAATPRKKVAPDQPGKKKGSDDD